MSDYQKPCGYPVMDCALGVYVTKCENRIEELEAKLRKSALQELSALGQASEAYQAQLAAEARIVDLEAKLEAERERCAKVAESVALPMDGRNAKAQADYMSKVIASAIRAELRGQGDE